MKKITETKWYSKREICDVCNVGHVTFERFILILADENQKYIQKRPSRKGGYLYAEPILQQFQLWLMKNQANQGRSSQVIKQAVHNSVENNGYKYTKEEICKICNCSIRTFESFAPKVLAERDFISVGSNHKRLYAEPILQKFQLWLLSNQANQGRASDTIKSIVKDAVKNEDKYIYSAKEIWELSNVSSRTWDRFVAEFLIAIDCDQKKDYLEEHPSRSGGNKYTEKTLRTFQAWLLSNQANQGRTSQVVKQATKDNLELGALAHVALTNREAWEQFKALGDAKLETEERLKLEQQQNQKLQLENHKLNEENNYLKRLNDFNTTQLGYYTKKYHSWYDDYENY